MCFPEERVLRVRTQHGTRWTVSPSSSSSSSSFSCSSSLRTGCAYLHTFQRKRPVGVCAPLPPRPHCIPCPSGTPCAFATRSHTLTLYLGWSREGMRKGEGQGGREGEKGRVLGVGVGFRI